MTTHIYTGVTKHNDIKSNATLVIADNKINIKSINTDIIIPMDNLRKLIENNNYTIYIINYEYIVFFNKSIKMIDTTNEQCELKINKRCIKYNNFEEIQKLVSISKSYNLIDIKINYDDYITIFINRLCIFLNKSNIDVNIIIIENNGNLKCIGCYSESANNIMFEILDKELKV